MKGFALIYSDSVKKYIKNLNRDVQIKIVRKLDLLLVEPKLLDIVKMSGKGDTYRVRIGGYRAIFVVDFENKSIKIEKLDTRSGIEKHY